MKISIFFFFSCILIKIQRFWKTETIKSFFRGMNVESIVAYVCCAIAIVLALFCLFKILNLTRKINSVSDFINGEAFSTKFHSLLANYFSDSKNTKFVFEPIVPFMKDILKEDHESSSLEPIGAFLV